MKSPTIRSTEYVYRKEDGTTAYKIVRSDKEDGTKDFGQWHFEGKKWMPGIAGIPRVPYMLPEVLKVVASGGLTIRVEGEKCADRLNKSTKGTKYNIIATCNNGGAGNWTDEQSVYLKDARVCILPDNDEAGERDVITFCKRLKGIARSIKVVRLPGLGPKEDIYDWLEAGHTLEELRVLYHDAPEYEHPVEAPVAPRAPVVAREGVTGLAKWAQAALAGCADELASAATDRNNTLFTKSARLASIAAHGLLNQEECLSALESACHSNRYLSEHPYNSFVATFNSGWDRGSKNPCELPDPKRPKLTIELPKEQTWASVPVIVRGLINANVCPSSAPVLELITEAQAKKLLKYGDPFTVKQLLTFSKLLGRGLSEATIRKGLQRGASPISVEFVQVFLTIENSGDSALDESMGGKNSISHITSQYKLLPVQDILNSLISCVMGPLIKEAFPAKEELVAPILAAFFEDLDRPEADSTAQALMDEYGKLIDQQPGYQQVWRKVQWQYQNVVRMLRHPEYAPLPEGQYRNTSEYMTLCARAIMIAHGGETQMSLWDWSVRLGCTSRNVNAVLRRAGVEVSNEQHSERIVSQIAQIKGMKRGFDQEMQGYPRTVSSNQSRSYVKVGSKRLVSWCEQELEKGASLTIRYTQANKQRLKLPDEVAEPAKPKPIGTPYVAPKEVRKSEHKSWIDANLEKAAKLVAKHKNAPIKVDGKTIANEQGGVQLTLDWLMHRETPVDAIVPVVTEGRFESMSELEAIAYRQHQNTEAIVAELVALGGTVSATYDAGTAGYQAAIDHLLPNWTKVNLTHA